MLSAHAPPHRKHRRRRRQDKPPVSARLLLDPQLKGDIAVLSEDLYDELFPLSHHGVDQAESPIDGTTIPPEEHHHVAICPWTAPSTNPVDSSNWTVVPVRPAVDDQQRNRHHSHSTIRFPSSSSALHLLSRTLGSATLAKALNKKDGSVEVLVLDAVPVELDTLFVTVPEALLTRLDDEMNSQRSVPNAKSRHAHIAQNGHTTATSLSGEQLTEDRLRDRIRQSIHPSMVVHERDILPLSVASHPITHALPPPAKVARCEPVAQGVLSSKTKIIVIRTHRKTPSKHTFQPSLLKPTYDVPEDEEGDTSDDRFYSAAEDGNNTGPSSPSDREESEANLGMTETSDSDSADDLSDDSLEDMISLAAPSLHQPALGSLSGYQSGTPRTKRESLSTNGLTSPGSVFSNNTTTSARDSGIGGRLFRAQGLWSKIPDASLSPRPPPEEDNEARVFIPIRALVKLGVFSGDWVIIMPATGSSFDDANLLHMSLGGTGNSRVARVYALPESCLEETQRASSIGNGVERKASNHAISTALLSPILLANLGSPSHLRISSFHGVSASNRHIPSLNLGNTRGALASLAPPTAKEVTLLKLSTPQATDRTMHGAFLAGLKQHFERKPRLVKSGDLVTVKYNAKLAKLLFQGTSRGEDEVAGDELLADLSTNGAQAQSLEIGSNPEQVAWFQVGQVTVQDDEIPAEDVWAGVTLIDSAITRMVQTGSAKGKLPATSESTWEYYLGVKNAPKSQKGRLTVDSDLRHSSFHVPKLQGRLRELITAATSLRAIQLGLPPLSLLLTSTQRAIGKATTASLACADLGIYIFEVDAYDILTEGAAGGDVKTEAFLKARAERAMSCGPDNTVLLVRHIDALTAERMTAAFREMLALCRCLIATTTDIEKIPDGVRGLFTHELEMSAPDEGEREGLLRAILEDQGCLLASDVNLSAVALKTAALVAGDLVDVIDRASIARTERIESMVDSASQAGSNTSRLTARDVFISGGDAGRCLTKADFDFAIDAARKNFADSIGAPKIPNVTWDDVGGLAGVKDSVMETIQLPLERPELFAKGLKKRSGILFYGPPGTGKTLLAKAIATEFSLNFFSVKGPELLNMYIGESEANVRRVFQRARDARPCVVFFDELDSVAPKRGNQGDSGGVMDRIVSQLLAELDGMSDGEGGGGGVFVIGATNRPDLLDAALLRPGRFDKLLYLGISDTHAKQLTILQALTRKFTLHPELSLERVSETLPFTFTGADLYALCSDAMLKAITRQANAVDEKIKALPNGPVTPAYYFDHFAVPEDTNVMVTEEDFAAAGRELVGSVSAKELQHYEKVRRAFEAADDKASVKIEDEGETGLSYSEYALRGGQPNGKGKDKGKGKGKAVDYGESAGESDYSGQNGFQEGFKEDEDELYE